MFHPFKSVLTPVLSIFVAVLAIVGAFPAPTFAQDSAAVQVRIDGFFKADGYYDSRQTVAAREGEFLLYPAPAEWRIGDTGERLDTNARNNINLTSFWSRVIFALQGPSVAGTQTRAVIDGDFMGTQNGFQNLFRLRHGFIAFEKAGSELLLGQFWSPLSVGAAVPHTISFNVGAPMRPQAKFPQIRLTTSVTGGLDLIGALSVQRDGFQEISGRAVQHQSGVPGLHLHSRYRIGNVMVGGGGYLRTIRPTLRSDRVRSGAASVYGQYSGENWSWRVQSVYGSDMADHVMIGGYVRATRDGRTRYRNTEIFSLWSDLSTHVLPVELGLFTGLVTNLGIGSIGENEILEQAFVRGASINRVWRVSPRLAYRTGPLKFGLEYEATTARFADDWKANLTSSGSPSFNAETNHRVLVSTFLFF